MRTKTSKLAQVFAITAGLATAFALPAAAEGYAHHHRHHHHALNYRHLTVARAYAAPVAPDPYTGPAAIVTAPVAIVATFVSLPFRAAGAIFPYTGNSPLVVVGAPAHFAGQVVNFPFYVVGNAFGAAPTATY